MKEFYDMVRIIHRAEVMIKLCHDWCFQSYELFRAYFSVLECVMNSILGSIVDLCGHCLEMEYFCCIVVDLN